MGKAQSKLSPEQLSELQKSTKCMCYAGIMGAVMASLKGSYITTP